MTTNVQKHSTNKEARETLKAQLAEYLAQQPESTRNVHKWMKRVEAAGLGIVLAAFSLAMYITIISKGADSTRIPAAWFFFATCLSLMAIPFGLHAILIRAYPPVILPGKVQKFVAGSGALWIGATSIISGLALAAIWLLTGYAAATFNLAMIVPLANALGVIMGIGILVSIVYSIYQKFSQAR